MSPNGTSRTSRDVRRESVKWAKADIEQVAVTNRDFMSTRPRLLQVRHEQAVGHALLKVPDHRRLACRDRDCQRLARSRSELDDIGPIALRAEDHDPVVASHYRRLVLCHSSSASRFTAGAAGFFILSQSGERPER